MRRGLLPRYLPNSRAATRISQKTKLRDLVRENAHIKKLVVEKAPDKPFSRKP
jgi:hypothetical protein